jgi:putative sterol carrier protein
VLQFNVTGEGGGSWTTTIQAGRLEVAEGTVASPSLTITCTVQDLLGMVNGELNAVSAYMQGRVKIDGNMSLAIKLQNLLAVEGG